MNNWKWPGPALLFPYPTDAAHLTTLERALLQLLAREYSALRIEPYRIEPYQWPDAGARKAKWPTIIRGRNDSGMSGWPVKTLFARQDERARGPGGRRRSAKP